MRLQPVLVGSILLIFAKLSTAQYGYNYDANYYDDYSLYTAGYHYDMYDEDDEGLAFNPYTNTYDDSYSDYYFDSEESQVATCRIGSDGKPIFNGTQPCDLVLSNADNALSGLTGGLEGNYKVWSCENGRPLYKREGSPPTEERILWYSDEFRDWDLVNGTVPRDDDILVYGGSGAGEKQPDHVAGKWSVATEFLKEGARTEDYTKFDLKVACADGSTPASEESYASFGKKPLLTDREMDAQYNQVYARAVSKETSSDVNLGSVTILVMIGLGIVFGLPYLMARTRKGRRGGKGGVLSSLFDFKKQSHKN